MPLVSYYIEHVADPLRTSRSYTMYIVAKEPILNSKGGHLAMPHSPNASVPSRTSRISLAAMVVAKCLSSLANWDPLSRKPANKLSMDGSSLAPSSSNSRSSAKCLRETQPSISSLMYPSSSLNPTDHPARKTGKYIPRTRDPLNTNRLKVVAVGGASQKSYPAISIKEYIVMGKSPYALITSRMAVASSEG